MNTLMNIPEIENLVAAKAGMLGGPATAKRVRVFESLDSTDHPALVVQILSDRPAEGLDWARLRLRFSQSIRDLLLERGDDRYPLIEFFTPEEWAARDD